MSKQVNISSVETTEKFPLKLVEKLYTRLVLEMNFELSPSNITMYLVTLMQLVESVTSLKGHDKKNLVIQVMEFLIMEQIRDDNEYKEQLTLLVKLTLPELIDTIVSIDRKEVKIKIKKGVKNVLGGCCPKTKTKK